MNIQDLETALRPLWDSISAAPPPCLADIHGDLVQFIDETSDPVFVHPLCPRLRLDAEFLARNGQ